MQRRRYLSASGLAVSGLLAGCLNDDEGTTGTDDTESESDDWPTFFGLRIEDTFDTGAAIEFSTQLIDGITVAKGRGSLESEQPGLVDLTVKNTADEDRTVKFDGFVPFPNPRAENADDGEMYELLVVPERDSGTDFDVNDSVPEYERIADYWEVAYRLEQPDTTTAVTLEPGKTITVGHDIVAAMGHLENSGTDGPYVGSYPFESSITVVRPGGDRSTAEMGFTVDVSYHAE